MWKKCKKQHQCQAHMTDRFEQSILQTPDGGYVEKN
jgi:hypothetical protein